MAVTHTKMNSDFIVASVKSKTDEKQELSKLFTPPWLGPQGAPRSWAFELGTPVAKCWYLRPLLSRPEFPEDSSA